MEQVGLFPTLFKPGGQILSWSKSTLFHCLPGCNNWVSVLWSLYSAGTILWHYTHLPTESQTMLTRFTKLQHKCQMLASSACGGFKVVICSLKKALCDFSNPESRLRLLPSRAKGERSNEYVYMPFSRNLFPLWKLCFYLFKESKVWKEVTDSEV